jgi:hypothetical protein
MHALRKEHAAPQARADDAERDRGVLRLRADLGRLDVIGVVAHGERDVTVRVKGSKGPVGTFRFVFTPEGKAQGVEVEPGD